MSIRSCNIVFLETWIPQSWCWYGSKIINCSVTRLNQGTSIKQSTHPRAAESGVHMRASLFHASHFWSELSRERGKIGARNRAKKKTQNKRRWKRQISGNLDCIPPPSSSARAEPLRKSADNISHTSQNTLGYSDGVQLHLKSNEEE